MLTQMMSLDGYFYGRCNRNTLRDSSFPGAMFLVAYINDLPLLGVPACGLHHRITLLDLVLPPNHSRRAYWKKRAGIFRPRRSLHGLNVCYLLIIGLFMKNIIFNISRTLFNMFGDWVLADETCSLILIK